MPPFQGLAARGVIVAAVCAAALGCGPRPPAEGPGPSAPLRAARVRIPAGLDTLTLCVEVAETPIQQRVGLRGRTDLPPDRGMLFRFPELQPPGSGFWMYRTPLPLSVALLDESGLIREILDMEPCRSRVSLFCRQYPARVPFRAALEVNRGVFARHGIAPGDRVMLPPSASAGGCEGRGSRAGSEPLAVRGLA